MTKCMSTVINGLRPPNILCAFQLLVALQLTICGLGTSEPLQFYPNVREMSFTTGDTAELHCTVRRPAPGNFTWTGPAVSSGRATIVNFASGIVSKLTIVGFTQQDAGLYNCSFTGVGNISIPLRVVSTPGFLTVPEHQVFVEGTDAVVECPAFFGNPPVRMLWSRDGRLIQNGIRFTAENGRLRIQNIRMDDMGDNYECRLLLSNGSIRKTIKVEVVAHSELAPRINDANRRTEVAYGDPLDLPCILDEPKDNVTYSWTINTEFELDHQVNTRANLHREAYEFLGGIYTCRAENEYGYDVVHFVVKVVAAPPLPANCSARPETREEGATIVLEYCTLTSPVQPSELTFQWSKQGQNGERINIIEDGMKFSINNEGVLTITNTQLSDSGTYLVNISNNQGFALHTIHLEVTARSKNPSATTSQTEIGLIIGGVLAVCVLWCVLWCIATVCYWTHKSQVYQRRQQVVLIEPRPALRAQLQTAEELEIMEQIPASHLNIECDRISSLPTSNVEHPEHFIWCNLGHLKFM